MMWKLAIASALILAACFASMAQSATRSTPPASLPSNSKGSSQEADQDIDLPAEMRSRLAIERAEDEHKKFVEDVKKLDELSSDVAHSYQASKRLSPDDLKKLGAIEKLARRVLYRAGGNAVEDDELKNLEMPDAIERLTAAATAIKTNLMTETRHVVSAAVIGHSNEIINLTQTIRRTKK